jgi:hypothetical protein
MNLTPIYIKGKRRRPGEPRPPTLKDIRKLQAKQALQPRPKILKRLRRKGKCPLLEKLPLEVLERIFVFSENVEFLKCSRKIGGMLSNHSSLVEFVAAAFGPTWDNWFGCVSKEVMSYKGNMTQHASRLGGDPKFQVGFDPRGNRTLRLTEKKT